MSDSTQETDANANSSNVMTYNSITDALEITTLTIKKGQYKDRVLHSSKKWKR